MQMKAHDAHSCKNRRCMHVITGVPHQAVVSDISRGASLGFLSMFDVR